MHIVFVTTELATATNSTGGLGSFTANIARIFAENGHMVTVVLATSKEENAALGSGICVENIYVRKSLWNLADYISKLVPYRDKRYNEELRRFWLFLYKGRKVRRKLKEINGRTHVDIVHYCNHGGFSLFHKKQIPYTVRISGFLNIWKAAGKPKYTLDYQKNPLTSREKLEEYAVKKAAHVISPSELLKRIACENLGVTATVLESPFLLSRGSWDYRCYDETAKGKRYIIHYGTLCYIKGTHIVAQIIHALLANDPSLLLVMAGESQKISDNSGSKIPFYELVKRNAGKYSDRVIYAGALIREQLYPLIQNAELCLFPSRIENLSNACIEAMAMGKIVVATEGASYEQLIEDRVSGFLCERDNPDSFLEAVNEALRMPTEEKQKMEVKALEVTKRLEPEKIYQQYLDFYEEVIKDR